MAEDFGKEVRELWTQAEEADKTNREEALADLKFAGGEHWDARVRQWREQQGIEKYGFPLPCLTINNIPAIVGQVTGDRLANEVSVKVLPNEEGDKETADVRSELIRSIEVRSKAQRTYRTAFQAMVNCGISNFRVDLDYAYDDVFERDIFVRSIPNPLAVLWDPLSADPTAKDAGWCFVAETITKDEYKRRFKEEATSADDFSIPGLQAEGWMLDDTVRIAEYWKIVEKPRLLAMLQDGSVKDVTDMPEADWKPLALVHPTKGPVVRKAPRKYAQRQVTNGRDALDDLYELPLCRLPVIRVSGQEIWEGDKRTRFGLVRFARDPARLKDYFRSLLAEKLMLSPRANWAAEARAVKGRESDWINAMIYNDGAAPPVPMTNNDLAAMMNQAEWFAEDMKDVTGIFDASRGMKSNETSGIAIQRRQHEGDIATIGYHENMNAAQQEAGEVINDLLPVAYDTPRTVRLIGANEATKFLRVNDPDDDKSIDLSKGRYDVTIATGPAYMTRRIEGATQVMELANRDGGKLMGVAGDLVIKSLDLVDGDEMAERYKRAIPPEILGADADENMPPEERMAKMQQAEQAKQLQQQMQALAMRKAVAETDEAEAKAEKARAEAKAISVKPLIEGHQAETARIKAVTAKDFPLPPEAAAILAPLITQAVLDALGSPDVLPLQPDEEEMIAEGALREAALAEMNNGPAPVEGIEQ